MKARWVLSATVGALLMPATVGCGTDPKDVTCSNFAAMSCEDQNNTLDDLLSDHDLQTSSTLNLIGVPKQVDSYCGTIAFSTEIGQRAGRNGAEFIDNAVAWDSKTWG